MRRRLSSEPLIEGLEIAAYSIPTEQPESDGTYEWDKTILAVVEASAAGGRGTGYSYADVPTAALVGDKLAKIVIGRSAMNVPEAFVAMTEAIRNLGRPGICSMAIAAVDAALWDLKARLLNVPLVTLLGGVRGSITAYGSGGFTSYTDRQLRKQMADWASAGFTAVKMKVGREPERDPDRVRVARQAIGAKTRLFVDANGAYSRKQALAMAEAFAEFNVSWFEEPVSSDDLEGLRLMRDRAPAGMEIAAGEYGYDLPYFHRMLEAGAVDVLQADATRCSVTEFIRVGALCAARSMRLSAHTASSLHTHPCCSVPSALNVEYFVDHVRIERMLFDGAIQASGGVLRPDLSRPGIGIELKRADAERYKVFAEKTTGDD